MNEITVNFNPEPPEAPVEPIAPIMITQQHDHGLVRLHLTVEEATQLAVDLEQALVEAEARNPAGT